jgi:hypothetical protein
MINTIIKIKIHSFRTKWRLCELNINGQRYLTSPLISNISANEIQIQISKGCLYEKMTSMKISIEDISNGYSLTTREYDVEIVNEEYLVDYLHVITVKHKDFTQEWVDEVV